MTILGVLRLLWKYYTNKPKFGFIITFHRENSLKIIVNINKINDLHPWQYMSEHVIMVHKLRKERGYNMHDKLQFLEELKTLKKTKYNPELSDNIDSLIIKYEVEVKEYEKDMEVELWKN